MVEERNEIANAEMPFSSCPELGRAPSQIVLPNQSRFNRQPLWRWLKLGRLNDAGARLAVAFFTRLIASIPMRRQLGCDSAAAKTQ